MTTILTALQALVVMGLIAAFGYLWGGKKQRDKQRKRDARHVRRRVEALREAREMEDEALADALTRPSDD